MPAGSRLQHDSLKELVGSYIEDSPLRHSLPAEWDSDDEPTLSANAMAALNEFRAGESESGGPQDLFQEIWGLSQFWYSSETAAIVAREAVKSAGDIGSIACIACPSLFRQIRAEYPATNVRLFEYDPRFEVLGDFTLYDYKKPLEVPSELHGSFDVVVADPPYLSEECLNKAVQTMRCLGRSGSHGQADFFLLTGSSMRQHAFHLLRLRPVSWRPQHKSKLANEFLLYTTSQWAADRLQGWDRELDPAGGERSHRSSLDSTPRSRRSSLDTSPRLGLDALRRASFSGEGVRRPSFDLQQLLRPSLDSAVLHR